MKMNGQVRSKLNALSLKTRLILIFLCLVILTSITVSLFFFQYKRNLEQAMSAASRVRASLLDGTHLKEILSGAQLKSNQNRSASLELDQFGVLLDRLETREPESADLYILYQIREAFEKYSKIAENSKTDSASRNRQSGYYFETLGKLSDLVQQNEIQSDRILEEIEDDQRNFTWALLWILGGFIAAALSASMRLLTSVTRPISGAVEFLDKFNVEEDFHDVLAKLNSHAPEISKILKSVDRLLDRLKAYRDLNLRRLLKEKRRADIIAASISDGIFLLHGEEVLYVNPTAERILGLQSGQFRKGFKLVEESSVNGTSGVQAVKRAVSRIIPVEFSLNLEEKKYYYLIQSFPISYDLIGKNEDKGESSSLQDVAERIQADTLVLAQDVTLVKEGQEAKSHFLATLSHEIKTPVTSLTMATRLLKKSIEQFPNATHQNLIATCVDDVDRLRRLLEDLLTVSRFDTLTQKLEFQKIDLGKLLVHSVQSFQMQAKERGVELTHQIITHGKPLLVTMDATKIAWALSNLLTNALRHSPRGGKVEVRLEALDSWTELSVKDNGPGIDRHRQDRIFDKFSSYYDLRIARSGSVGAGLAIAKEIVVAHGGRIWVVSEPGKGAEFCFRLPLKGNDLGMKSDYASSKPYETVPERLGEKNGFSF